MTHLFILWPEVSPEVFRKDTQHSTANSQQSNKDYHMHHDCPHEIPAYFR